MVKAEKVPDIVFRKLNAKWRIGSGEWGVGSEAMSNEQ
jgi:hypothetical protein